MTIEDEIGGFLDEWMATIREVGRAVEAKDFASIRDHVDLPGTNEPGNYVNRKGYDHLVGASRLLLKETRLSQRVRLQSAVEVLVKAHFELLPKAKISNQFSENAIRARARELLINSPRATGIYVYPLVFAPKAKKSDWQVGPVRILSKERLLSEYREAIDAERGAIGGFRASLVADWEVHIAAYDHFALVQVADHEQELAESIAREAAEFALNLIRMRFRYYHTDDIRIGGGFVFEVKRSSLYFDKSGSAIFTSTRGPHGTQLDDDWVDAISYSLGGVLPMFGAYLTWFLSGRDPDSPVIERIRYGSTLIAECYAEPYDHIRLVRLVSALETFALVGSGTKSDEVAINCALIGGCGNPENGCDIYDAVRSAYAVRNAIVHGDRPSQIEIRKAFFGLEKHALDIFVSFINFFENLQSWRRPQSVKQLRQMMKQCATYYYWYPEIAFW